MKYGELTLGQMEAICNKLGGMDGVRDFLAGELIIKRPELLKRVATTEVVGVESFVADEAALKAANIGWTGENFKQFFTGKTEENVPCAKVAGNSLLKASLDAPILAELGEKAEIQLATFFAMLKKQSKGEAGFLLVNGCWNVVYIRGKDRNLWAVDAFWDSFNRDWRVEAYSVGDSRRWYAGDQVLSRDS